MKRAFLFLTAAVQLAAVAAPALASGSVSTGVAPWLVNGNPAVVLGTLATPFWINNFGDGSWVGTTSLDGNLAGGASPGSYVFTLALGSFVGDAGTFNLQYAADNSISWSISNGTLGGDVTCGPADCFTAAGGAPRSLNGNFAADSILTASVINIGSSPSPMGLLAVGTYTANGGGGAGPGGNTVPEPSAWVMLVSGFALSGGMLRARRQRVRFVTA